MCGKVLRLIRLIFTVLSGDLVLGPWLTIGLSLYSFTLFMVAKFMSVTDIDGHILLVKEFFFIVVVCLLLIEILNQVTYWLGKVKFKLAITLKCITFWLIFTGGIGTYIYFTTTVEGISAGFSREDLISLPFYLLFSWFLPRYSLYTDFRFLLVRGKFNKKII